MAPVLYFLLLVHVIDTTRTEVENVKFDGSEVHEVDLDGKVALSCFYHPPKANIDMIRWYKLEKDRTSLVYMYVLGSKENKAEPKYKNRVEHIFDSNIGRTTLIIKNCSQSDQGKFGCRIISSKKNITAYAKLLVRGKKQVFGRFLVCTLPEPEKGYQAQETCRLSCNSSLPDMSSDEQDILLREVMTQLQIERTWVTLGKWILETDRPRCTVVSRNEERQLEVVHFSCFSEQHVVCLRRFDISMEIRLRKSEAEITCAYSPKHVPSYVRWLRKFGNEEPSVIYDFNPQIKKGETRANGMKRHMSYKHAPEIGSTSLVIRTAGLRHAGLYTCEIWIGNIKLEAPGPLSVNEMLDFNGQEALVLPLPVEGSSAKAACTQYGLLGLPGAEHRDIVKQILTQFDIPSTWAACNSYDIYDSTELCCVAKQQQDNISINQVSCEDLSYVVCIGNPESYDGIKIFPGKRQYYTAIEMCADLGASYRIVERKWTTALYRPDFSILGKGLSAWLTNDTKKEAAETCLNKENCCEIVIWQDGTFRYQLSSCYDFHLVVCDEEQEYKAGSKWHLSDYIKNALIGVVAIICTHLLVKYLNRCRG